MASAMILPFSPDVFTIARQNIATVARLPMASTPAFPFHVLFAAWYAICERQRERNQKGRNSMKPIHILQAAAGIACMTFALAAAAQTSTTGSTAPSGSSETVGQHVDDATITTKVKADLLAANNVKSEHIHVKTRKGIVSLTGTVPSAEDRDNAKQVVENVSGVTDVKNHLKVVAE
jgi:hyperosmotically inducible periplasmic protein